jgi:hypothetical protein
MNLCRPEIKETEKRLFQKRKMRLEILFCLKYEKAHGVNHVLCGNKL